MHGDAREPMREGIRTWVGGVSRKGDHLAGLRADVLAALMVCGAFGGVAATAAGLGGAPGAVAGGFTAVGTGYLAEAWAKKVEQLRAQSGGVPSADTVTEELSAELQQAMAADEGQAEALRADIATVLQEVGAVEVAIREAVDLGNQEVVELICHMFEDLGAGFSEFGWALSQLRETSAPILRKLNQQGVELRRMNDRVGSMENLLRVRRLGPAADNRRQGWGRDYVALGEGGCPYRGLEAFRERDAELFFGRERLAAKLVSWLAKRQSGIGLLVVTGASGVGKSSLLRAGLLPALAAGDPAMPGTEHWPSVMITPTSEPLDELAAHVAAVAGLEAGQVRAGLATDPGRFDLSVRSAVIASGQGQGGRLLVVVDQFEQIFASDCEEEQRRGFITALHAAASRPSGAAGTPPALIVLCVRGDFRDRCADYEMLRQAVDDDLRVAGMTDSELRRAICEPAKAVGAAVDPDLADMLIRELRGASGAVSGAASAAGALPLLSHALAETWDHREGDRLTVASYGRTGGMEHALATSAEDVYSSLDARGQSLAREIFLSLVSVRDEGWEGSIPLPRSALRTTWPTEAGSALAIAERFAQRRLLTMDADTVQIAHEALIHGWERLHSWLIKDQELLHALRDVRDAAKRWERGNRDDGLLIRGPALAVAERKRQERPSRIDSTTGEFIIRSFVAETRSRAELYVAKDSSPNARIAAALSKAVSISQESGDEALGVAALEAALSFHVRTLSPLRAVMYWRKMWHLAHAAGLPPDIRRIRILRLFIRPEPLALAIELPLLFIALYYVSRVAVTLISNSAAHERGQMAGMIVVGVFAMAILWRWRRGLKHPVLAFPFVFLYAELAVHLPFQHRWTWTSTGGVGLAALAFLALMLKGQHRQWLETEETMPAASDRSF